MEQKSKRVVANIPTRILDDLVKRNEISIDSVGRARGFSSHYARLYAKKDERVR